jgi:hypothetical protein
MAWYFNPHTGGKKIPPAMHCKLVAQANACAAKREWYPKYQLKLRFRNQFCYLDAFEEGKESFPIGRLRYFSEDRWSLAFYTYSNESYQPCLFLNDEWFGTIKQAIDVCEGYMA